jgi:hypothetical protein
VPGLYNTEELEPIISLLKDVAAQEGFVGSPASYFFKCKVINRGCRIVCITGHIMYGLQKQKDKGKTSGFLY